MLAGIALLTMSVGCYETGAMSVPTKVFLSNEFNSDFLEADEKPNTLENQNHPLLQNQTPLPGSK